MAKAKQTFLDSSVLEIAVIFAAVIFAYASSLDGYFHGDDFIALVDAATKPMGKHLYEAVTFQDNNFYWRPLGQVYYRSIYEIAGLDATAFRIANLGLFLVTLAALHRLCLKLELSRPEAFAATLVFGLFPNHVVSVAWITDGARLLAMAFFVFGLLTLAHAISRRSLWLEGLAWLLVLAACFSDEVTIAMAPVPIAYAVLVHREYLTPLKLAFRTLAYGAIVVALLPLQFMFTPDDEPRLTVYSVGWHIPEQAWALASQLALPLAPSNPMDVPEVLIPDAQWIAGAVFIAVLGVCLLFGSGLVRFLVCWTIAALAPFTLWDLDVVAPRYVYLAGAPAAVLAVHLVFAAIERVGFTHVRLALTGAAAAGLVAVAVFGIDKTRERDDAWVRATRDYQVLAAELTELYPNVSPGTHFVIMDGPAFPYWRWPVAAVRTVYRDRSLSATSVPPGWPVQVKAGDVVLYYDNGQIHLTGVKH
jgi:hypothetical protein